MLEFYTDEFKRKGQSYIDSAMKEVKPLLPALLKWQMKQCLVTDENRTICYMRISNDKGNQVGTKVKIVDNKCGVEYRIISEATSLSVRKESNYDTTEIRKTYLDHNRIINERIFMCKNDYIIYSTSILGDDVTKTIFTNLDKAVVEDALLDIDVSDSMEYIRDFYFDNCKTISRIRTSK